MEGALGRVGQLRGTVTGIFGQQVPGLGGGLEWAPFKMLALRAGCDPDGPSTGLGLMVGGMRLDYSLQSLSGKPGHRFELGYAFAPAASAATSLPTPAPTPYLVTATPSMVPSATPMPTVTPLPTPQGVFADPVEASLILRASQYKEQGKAEASRQALDQALALHPNDETLKALRRSWEAPPEGMEDDEATRLASQAGMNEAQGRPELAHELWRAALQLRPGWAEARSGLRRTAHPALAHKAPARVRALDAEGMKAYLDGDLATAIKRWEEALKQDPGNPNVLNNLSRARAELKNDGEQP
jgi:hypothetical protein